MLASHKGEIPFFVLVIPFILGISTGLWLNSSGYEGKLATSFITLTCCYITFNIFYNKLNLHRALWIGGLLLHLLLFLGGWLCAVLHMGLNRPNHFSKVKANQLVVTVTNEPVLKGNLLRFTADVRQAINGSAANAVKGTLMVSMWTGIDPTPAYGDQLLIPATYKPVDPPLNPAEFNYKKYLANQNIYHQCFIDPRQVAVMHKHTGNPIIAYALDLRQQLVNKLKNNLHNSDAIAVASTLMLGYKADLSDDVLQAYSKTGTIHVLSVSGAHVAMVLVMLNIALGFLNRFKHGRTIRAFVTILLIWGYALLTGFSPAVCRAAAMITLFIIGKTYNRHANGLNILAVSAFFLLLYNPFLITDVGFQLSYLAMFGLIVLQPVVYRQLEINNKWLDKLWIYCSASIAIQLITFPLSALYFHHFPVYFLFSNLLIVLPAFVLMYAGALYLALPEIPFLSKALAFILENTIILLNEALTYIEHLPYASIDKVWFTTAEYLLLTASIIGFCYYLCSKRSVLLKLSLCGLLLICTSFALKSVTAYNNNQLVFFNLKKHTGIAFKQGNKAVVVTDLLASEKPYRYSVQPYLDSSKASNMVLCGLGSNYKSSFLFKQAGIIQFLNNRIAIIDKSFKLPASKVDVDYLFVTGSPHISLADLNKHFQYQLLIIDANNSNQQVARFEREAKLLNAKYYTIKRNKALVLASK